MPEVKETETKPEIKEPDISLKEKQTVISPEKEDLANLKVKDFAIKNQIIPTKEFQMMTLIAQREKLSRDEITSMMLAGEEALKMLIRNPSPELITFITHNLEDEDRLLLAIPRYDIPKPDFEAQVLREMRMVLRENVEKINEKSD